YLQLISREAPSNELPAGRALLDAVDVLVVPFRAHPALIEQVLHPPAGKARAKGGTDQKPHASALHLTPSTITNTNLAYEQIIARRLHPDCIEVRDRPIRNPRKH